MTREGSEEAGTTAPLVKTCVENVEFQAAHITPIYGVKTLHGHTFKLAVCVSGRLTREGWVIDFLKLRDLACSLVKPYNNALLADRSDVKAAIPAGNFVVKLMAVEGPPTAENLALRLCKEIGAALLKDGAKGVEFVEVKLWEGSDSYVEVRCGLDLSI